MILPVTFSKLKPLQYEHYFIERDDIEKRSLSLISQERDDLLAIIKKGFNRSNVSNYYSAFTYEEIIALYDGCRKKEIPTFYRLL